jgi:hypothetical protein
MEALILIFGIGFACHHGHDGSGFASNKNIFVAHFSCALSLLIVATMEHSVYPLFALFLAFP